jgi:hypothetical protein
MAIKIKTLITPTLLKALLYPLIISAALAISAALIISVVLAILVVP